MTQESPDGEWVERLGVHHNFSRQSYARSRDPERIKTLIELSYRPPVSRWEELYYNLKIGDPISDVDLEDMIGYFGLLHNMLSYLGPVFDIARKEALDVLITLEGYQRHRMTEGSLRDKSAEIEDSRHKSRERVAECLVYFTHPSNRNL